MAVKKNKTKDNPTNASRATLESHIKNGQYSRIYLICGTDQYLMSFYRDMLRDALITKDDTMNYVVYDRDNFNVNSVVNDAVTIPFFGEHRVVVVNNSGYFDKSEIDILVEADNIPDTNVLIFCEESVTKNKKAFMRAAKNEMVTILEFTGLGRQDLITWVGSILGEDGVKVKISAPERLIDICGPAADMNMLQNEATKVHDYCMSKGVVESADVELLCENEVEDKIFEMCRYISQKNSRMAIKEYQDLLELKRSATSIIYRIGAQFDQLLQIKQILQDGGGVPAVIKRFNISEWIASRLVNQCNDFTMEELISAVDKCQNATYLNNTGQLLGNASVENLIINLLI